MRIVVPLPFGEIELNVRGRKRSMLLFWCVLFSAFLHLASICLVAAYLIPRLLPVQPKERPPIFVSISSATRIEHKTVPHAAKSPEKKPPAQKTVVAQVAPQPAPPEPKPQQEQQRRELAVERPQAPTLASRLAADNKAFAQTAARLSSEDDPMTGAAQPTSAPAAPKQYTLDLEGRAGHPEPEGVLYPLKRWVEGEYVYYYVRYLARYADGSTETGSVPWPIRFPKDADPFAHGIHEMPLPGPPGDFVLADGAVLEPLVKNCYDHRYSYCPIEREE